MVKPRRAYQGCNKWLKDREDRTLSKDDIAHYQKIDEVIEQYGGWLGAFKTGNRKEFAYTKRSTFDRGG